MSALATGELHVAAMPFPTRQGTQAIVHAMLSSRVATGHRAELLTYGSGEHDAAPPYPLHRLPRIPGRASFVSGPSVRKLALDAMLVRAIAQRQSEQRQSEQRQSEQRRSEQRPHRGSVTVAHHVEASIACAAASARPLVFFAHTDLGPELPTYLPSRLSSLAGLARRGGEAMDLLACRSADAVAAISPLLAGTLTKRSGRDVRYVPAPWRIEAPTSADERATARGDLGFTTSHQVLLYAGNLDAYQGLPVLLDAFARAHRQNDSVRLLIATASSHADRPAATHAGVRHALRYIDLPADEKGRRRLRAIADLAVIPRGAAGGLPIKLLDALARGLPTVAARRAAAGIPLENAALLVDDDDADAMANGISTLLASKQRRTSLGAEARLYIAKAHNPVRFDAAMDEVIAIAREHAERRTLQGDRG